MRRDTFRARVLYQRLPGLVYLAPRETPAQTRVRMFGRLPRWWKVVTIKEMLVEWASREGVATSEQYSVLSNLTYPALASIAHKLNPRRSCRSSSAQLLPANPARADPVSSNGTNWYARWARCLTLARPAGGLRSTT